jgi:exopolysaccharide production protein ExoZ
MCVQYFNSPDAGEIAIHNPTLNFYGNWLTVEFLGGCLLATLYREGWFDRVPLVISASLLALGIALIIACAAFHGSPDEREKWKGLPAFVVVAAALAIERSNPFRNRTLHRLGDATYSLYLTHIFVVMLFRKLWLMAHLPTTGYRSLAFIAICIVVAVPLGVAVYEFKYGERWLVTKAKDIVKRWPPPWPIRSRTRRA